MNWRTIWRPRGFQRRSTSRLEASTRCFAGRCSRICIRRSASLHFLAPKTKKKKRNQAANGKNVGTTHEKENSFTNDDHRVTKKKTTNSFQCGTDSGKRPESVRMPSIPSIGTFIFHQNRQQNPNRKHSSNATSKFKTTFFLVPVDLFDRVVWK